MPEDEEPDACECRGEVWCPGIDGTNTDSSVFKGNLSKATFKDSPMPNQVQILRVVVASPADVIAERKTVSIVVEEINKSVSVDRGLRLEAIRWETDTYPGFHPEGPQSLIDSILRIEDCDILVGIFWKRFGTPTHDSASGTQHEFRLANAAWKQHGRPQVMMYFNQKPYTPQSKEEMDQWSQVLEFRKAFPKEGLWWPYKGTSQFERLLRTHLSNFLRDRFPVPKTVVAAAVATETQLPQRVPAEGGQRFSTPRSERSSQLNSRVPSKPRGVIAERLQRKALSIERIKTARVQIARLAPEEKIIVDKQIGRGSLVVINDDICQASTDIIVSSDDNHFSARGGVSQAIIKKLGPDVRRQLDYFRRQRFHQGQVTITTGGKWERRAIIHAAVIDLDENRYPTIECIRSVTRRALECAVALGAKSIAFPVFGGGYATKHLKPTDSVNAVASEILTFLSERDLHNAGLTRVALYIFNREDADGLPKELIQTEEKNR